MAIKKLQNDFTTPEQSKRLRELGVPADSADCYYAALGFGCGYETYPNVCAGYSFSGNIDLPCWSVGRLMEIMEICSRYSPCQFDFTGTRIEQLIQAFDFLSMLDKFDFSKLEE